MKRPRLVMLSLSALVALAALASSSARSQDASTPDGGAAPSKAGSPDSDEDPSKARDLHGCVLRAQLGGVVNHGAADYLADAVDAAEDGPCQALLLVVDTPGGMLDATRSIVRTFLGADVPVVAWVGPGGAHAGSAGVFITMSAHVAAMAPGTNIGAAHPVSGTGQD
ncbi:MAG: hypothetical protein ACOCUS_04495, partial [Polyangiales bacterium]